MKNFLRKFIFLFSLLNLSKVKYLFILLILAVILEGIGVGLVLPAISLIMGNNTETTEVLKNYLNLESSYFIYSLLFAVFLVYITKNLLVIFLQWYELRISKDLKIQITEKLFNVYLSQPFSVTSKVTSGTILRNLNSVAQTFIIFGQAILAFIADLLFVSVILLVLLINYPFITIPLGLIFFAVAISYVTIMGKFLKKWSYIHQIKTKNFYQDIQESVDSIKEIKLMNLAGDFKKQLNNTIVPYFDLQKKLSFFGNLGRPVVEIFGILLIGFFLVYMIQRNAVNKEVFSFLSLFVFVLLRMLPLTTKIINTLNKFAAMVPNVTILYDVIKNTSYDGVHSQNSSNLNKIELKNVSFAFNKEKKILNNINFTIKKGEINAIIGESGAGKSTFINILSGLLKNTDGDILINDEKINNALFLNYKIGYIPQRPLLINKSIKTNICIVTDEKNIDSQLLDKVVKQSCLIDVIEKQHNGIDTEIGEKSNFISGGEAQRIAIARALYAKSQILLLDEPTSSLDPKTELNLMNNLQNISKDVITIITSHKMNLLKYCNKVYKLENSQIYLTKD